ncbi:hypothetical protein Hokovirus_3_8 [Hokovirus HKV1]|uniref:Uncharacterized protein n=1 Tax=Hokovirus HKV1 TaxID=1977638 RepID=A0A1V0SG91_9VIRU|nr:hypothetical protein Hokovirus_3_8 [Hokovirus HKV1]
MNLEEKYKSEITMIRIKILEKKINDILNNYKNTINKNIFYQKDIKYNLISNYKYYRTEPNYNKYILTIYKIFLYTCFYVTNNSLLYKKIVEIKNKQNYIKNQKKVSKYYNIIGIQNMELLLNLLSQII